MRGKQRLAVRVKNSKTENVVFACVPSRVAVDAKNRPGREADFVLAGAI
jgi:hypothetical protein